jgi:hypothetical protein
MPTPTQEQAALREERTRLRTEALKRLRDGIGYLEALWLLVIGGRAADLTGFDWPGLQSDLQRLGELGRRLGPLEQEPLSEEACDGICRVMAARRR